MCTVLGHAIPPPGAWGLVLGLGLLDIAVSLDLFRFGPHVAMISSRPADDVRPSIHPSGVPDSTADRPAPTTQLETATQWLTWLQLP
jgi:hypothetical protein